MILCLSFSAFVPRNVPNEKEGGRGPNTGSVREVTSELACIWPALPAFSPLSVFFMHVSCVSLRIRIDIHNLELASRSQCHDASVFYFIITLLCSCTVCIFLRGILKI